MKDKLELHWNIEKEESRAMFIAELSQLRFEAFEEQQDGLKAYIDTNDFNQHSLDQLIDKYKSQFPIRFVSQKIIKAENWNNKWEEYYDPIKIKDQIYVYASFHDTANFPYKININPKMSFGTGHHETTSMMLELMLDIDFENKSILDFGCGTAILAIFAAMKNANPIEAIEKDDWVCENAIENLQLNQIENIQVCQKDQLDYPKNNFDIVLANINRNVILSEMENICQTAKQKILLSGILKEHKQDILKAMEAQNWQYNRSLEKGNWVAIQFHPQSN